MPEQVNRFQRAQNANWRLLLVLVALFFIALGVRISTTGVGIDTDVQAILPQSTGNGAEIAAIRQAGSSVSARIVTGVVGGDSTTRQLAVADLTERLQSTGIFVPAATDVSETLRWTRANRYELSCVQSPKDLDANWGATLAQQAHIALFSGVVPLSGVDFAADPFLLDLHQISCLSPDIPSPSEAQVAGRLTASPFELSVQADIAQVIDDWRDDERFGDLTVHRSGAVFFAHAAGTQAKQEITIVGGMSVLLIILLYGMSFRSPGTAALALLTVTAGALGGAWACFVVFGTVHFSVFVFGSALTGISADYAVHTFAAHRAGHLHSRTKLRRALTISMLTSAAGFAALLVFNIALFKQIGVFAIGGLAAAWLFAIAVLPHLDRAAILRTTNNTAVLAPLTNLRQWGRRLRVRVAALVTVAIVLAAALPTLTFIDDLRRFQPLSPTLVAEQNQLFPAAKGRISTKFLLSTGPDIDAALEAEESALAALGDSADRFMALSRFSPSAIRRAQTRAAYKTHLFEPHLSGLQAQLGLPPNAAMAPNGDAPLPAWLGGLHFSRHEQVFLIAPLVDDAAALPSEVNLIDPAAIYGKALKAYRVSALRVFGIAAVFAALFLMLINRRAKAALLIVPSLMGCALAIAVPALLGVPITLFSVLALFIVLGAGIDFSVFQWEMSADETGWTGAAVVIAALSTCAAMGMLGFSATLPVQSFGITIAVGVLGAMVFSFMTPPRPAESDHAQDM